MTKINRIAAIFAAHLLAACVPSNQTSASAPASGVLDTTFATGTGFPATVDQVLVQNDANILVAGEFNAYNGTSASPLVRLSSAGALDTAFNAQLGAGPDNGVYALALAPNGSIYLGGDFASVNKQKISRVAKLAPNGTVSAQFLAGQISVGFDRTVNAVTLSSQGKLMAGGNFSAFASSRSLSIARFYSESSLDQNFQAAVGNGPNAAVNALLADPDGHTLVGGDFTAYNGNPRGGLVRLNADGSEDTAFAAALGRGFNGAVNAIVEDAAGNYYVGGSFATLGANNLVKLNHAGAVDNIFLANIGTGPGGTVQALALDAQGNVIVGGNFQKISGMNAGGLARVANNGLVDTFFASKVNLGFNAVVNTVAIQADGRILVGGAFTAFQGLNVRRIARIK